LKIFDACSNSGNISYAGKSNGSTNIGGLFGYLSYTANSTTKEKEPAYLVVRNGFVNTGNITHTGTTDGADNISIGGLLGYCSYGQFSKGEHVWTGDVVNKGKITCAGSSKGGIISVGGIIGYSNTNLPETARIVNLGEIEFTGDAGIKNEVPGTSYVGGIMARSADATVTNAESYCHINASKANYSGLILGSVRSETVIAKNCKVGGTIEKLVEKTDVENNVTTELQTITLADDNFYNYIYGSAVEYAQAAEDSCSCISEEPKLPTEPVVPPTTEETPVE
jgi:hypothetical protein